jgi:hypothetical protein
MMITNARQLLLCLALGAIVIPAAGSAGPTQSRDCTGDLPVQRARSPVDTDIDQRFDRTREGDSFSCDLSLRASEALAALESFRAGVVYGDKSRLAQVIRFPIDVSVFKTLSSTERPTVSRIHSADEWIQFQQATFTPLQLAAIACVVLPNVHIVKGREYGFMVNRGMVWFKGLEEYDHVVVTAINLVPPTEQDVVNTCTGGTR